MVDILKKVLNIQNLKDLYDEAIKTEHDSRQQLLDFNNEYHNSLNKANIIDILNMLNCKDK